MENPIKRKTNLFFSDIVGYSKMIANNESHTLDLLKEHDIILTKEIHAKAGTIIKHIGDAIFAEFPSINNAVEASIAIQKELSHRNSIYRGKDQFNIRIGLHQGDIVEKDGDLFGNDVNICSRIESISLPGSIAISNQALEQLNGNWYTHEYGKVKLKNIPAPQTIHRIYIDKADFQKTRHEDLINRLLDLNINIVNPDEKFEDDIKTIGFMYPQNLGKVEDDFFCHSFLEQLIGDFSKIEKIRTSDMFEVGRYKNADLSISELALKLSVSNIIQMSIINTEDNFKINLRLISMDNGDELIQETWSGKHNEQQKISGNIIIKIADIFNVELTEELKKLFNRENNVDNQAYKKYLEGKFLSDNMSNAGDLERSQQLLEEAIDIDDEFAEAYSNLGMTQNLLGDFEDAEEMLETALDLAEDSENDYALMTIYNHLGIYYKGRKKHKKAIRYFEQGIKLLKIYQDDLMEAKFLHNIAGSYSRIGDHDRALDFLYKSQKINKKLERPLGDNYSEIGVRYKELQKYDEAITYFNQAIKIYKSEGKNFNIARVEIIKSGIYITIGDFDKSIKSLDRAKMVAEEFEDELMDGRIMLCYANIHYTQKKYDKSKESITNAIDHFQNINNNNLILESMILLIQLHLETSDFDLANKVFKKCNRISKRVKDPIILSALKTLALDEKLNID